MTTTVNTISFGISLQEMEALLSTNQGMEIRIEIIDPIKNLLRPPKHLKIDVTKILPDFTFEKWRNRTRKPCSE